MDDNKAKALAAALSQIEKQFGKGSVMRMGDGNVERDIQTVSTGSLGLDIALILAAVGFFLPTLFIAFSITPLRIFLGISGYLLLNVSQCFITISSVVISAGSVSEIFGSIATKVYFDNKE